MNIISKAAKCGQERWVSTPSLAIGPNGLIVHSKGLRSRGNHLDGVKRSKITYFSHNSARRLREALFSLSVPDSLCIGATLTVPWKAEDFAPLMDEWRQAFERFRSAFSRRFPNSAVIYRNEIQKRGAPHIHAVAYIAAVDIGPLSHTKAQKVRQSLDCEPNAVSVAGDCECRFDLSRQSGGASFLSHKARSVNLSQEDLLCVEGWLRSLWLSAIKNMHGGSVRGFAKYGVDLNCLDAGNCPALYKYLCDHASKHKQEQLGYEGRQWGYIGRSNLKRNQLLDLPPFLGCKQEAFFWRMIRKLTRYTLDHTPGSRWGKSHPLKTAAHPEWYHLKGAWKRIPPFGCVHKGGYRRSGVIFIKGGKYTLERVWDASIALTSSAAADGGAPVVPPPAAPALLV